MISFGGVYSESFDSTQNRLQRRTGFGLEGTKIDQDICAVADNFSCSNLGSSGGQDQDQHARGCRTLHHAFGAEERFSERGRL
jgi:hypothetical protein